MSESLLEQVRALVGNPTRLPELRDALQAEAGWAIDAMKDPSFALGAGYSAEELARRANAFEAIAAALAHAVAVVGFWGTPELGRVVAEVTSRLANAVDRSAGVQVWMSLALYPALIVEYAAGLGAVAGGREAFLAPLLISPFVRERQEWKPCVLVLNPGEVIDERIGQELPDMARRFTPVSDHLFEILRDAVDGLVFDDATYELVFDRFECLLGLVIADLIRGDSESVWAPVGRFGWRARYREGNWITIGAELDKQGERWPLLQGGAFDGSADRMRASATAYFAHAQKVAASRF
jgi:hypothetical protein